MIITKKTGETISNQSTVKFEINNEDGHLYSVLSELYSDPVGSTIREISTNCIDAHIMSHNEERPFIIKLPNPDIGLNEITIRDFGPGLGIDDVLNIYRVYGKSTKNNNNNVTGCLGLGSKSPYSVATTFYVKSYLNGKIYLYTCSMDNNSIPTITDKPILMDTEEENGLEVIIPIYQKMDFSRILTKVLKYFKVKPLVYKQMGNTENDELIDIPWFSPKEMVKLTDTIHVPVELSLSENYLNLSTKKETSEVVQLQIHYPIDKTMILNTIERYNKNYIGLDGTFNVNYKISLVRIKLIEFLLDNGIVLYSVPGKIAFSPSREYIKYTEMTLEYIINELNTAAKYMEKIIFKNFHSAFSSYEKYFDTFITNYSKYDRYINFCNNLGITTKSVPKFTEYSNLVYENKPRFNHIIGSFRHERTKLNERNIGGIFKGFYQESTSDSYKRDFLNRISDYGITHVDAFSEDLYRKIGNINGSNTIVFTAILTDDFRKTMMAEITSLLENIQNDITDSYEKQFYVLYDLYTENEITYDVFISCLSYFKSIFSLTFENTENREYVISNFLKNNKNEIIQHLNNTNTSVSSEKTKVLKIIDALELPKTKLLMQSILSNHHRESIYISIQFLKGLLINNTSNSTNNLSSVFYYYLGRLFKTYKTKKTALKKVAHLDYMDQFDVHNIGLVGSNFYISRIELDEEYMNKNHSHFFNITDSKDKLFSAMGLLKFRNKKLIINFVAYLFRQFISKHENILISQLSLENYDLIPFVKHDLEKLNIPNIKNKVIKSVSEIPAIINIVSPRINFEAKPEISSSVSKIYTGDILLFDSTEIECREHFDYFKFIIKVILRNIIITKAINDVVNVNPNRTDSKTIFDEFKVIDENNKFDLIKNYNSDNAKFVSLNQTLHVNSNKINRLEELLSAEYSIENYNKLLLDIKRELPTMETHELVDEHLVKFISDLKLPNSMGLTQLPFKNKILHLLPENYNYESIMLIMPDIYLIDQIDFTKIIEKLKTDHQIIIFPKKITFSIKTNLNCNDFVEEWSTVLNDKPYKEIHGMREFRVFFKNHMRWEVYNNIVNGGSDIVKNKMIGISPDSDLALMFKKDNYNFYQFMLNYFRKHITEIENIPYSQIIYNYNGHQPFKNNNYNDIHFISELFNLKINYRNNTVISLMVDYLKMRGCNLDRAELVKAIENDRNRQHSLNGVILLKILLDTTIDEFFNLVSKGFPVLLMDKNLIKTIKINLLAFRKIYIKSIKIYFGKDVIKMINNFNIKDLNTKSEYTEVFDYVRLKHSKAIANMYIMVDVNHIILNYKKDLLVQSPYKKENTVYVEDYFPDIDLRYICFLGEIHSDVKLNSLSYTTYKKIENYKRFNKFITVDVDKRRYRKIENLIRHTDGKGLNNLSTFLVREKLHEKINIKQIKENRKNIQYVPEKHKKYYVKD